MTIGEHIMLLRKQKGLSQAELGKVIGTSGDVIGRYERDVITPSIDVIVNIADALEVSIDFLVGKTKMVLDGNTFKRGRNCSLAHLRKHKIRLKILGCLPQLPYF